jgi:Concanavalin A-like lectin/glucanases superfamily
MKRLFLSLWRAVTPLAQGEAAAATRRRRKEHLTVKHTSPLAPLSALSAYRHARRALALGAACCAASCVGAPVDVDETASTAQPITVIPAPSEGAASFGQGGVVDTDLPFGLAIPYNHTVSASFMLQHWHAQTAPILAARNRADLYSLTYDYMANPSRVAKLVLSIGGRTATFANTTLVIADTVSPTPDAPAWHHVAIVRQGTTFLLYLDGARQVGTGNVDASGNLVVPSGSPMPPLNDTLRIGRNADSDAVSQFFGLVDEVAVYNAALSQSEIATTLVGKKPDRNDARLDGYYSFDYNAPAPASWVYHTATFGGSVFRRTVSTTRAATDASAFLTPQNQTTTQLPFRVNDAYLVLWGNEINSHVGGAAFCWDFVRIGSGWSNDEVQANTAGQPLYTTAAGSTFSACDQGDLACNGGQLATKGYLTDGYNSILIQHLPTEISTFLHVQTGSVSAAFAENGYLFNPASPGAPSLAVGAHQHVANIGTRSAPGAALNYHLHYAFGSTAVTTPMAFSHYEASDDQGAHWHLVDRGVPTTGQWVRNIP